MDIISHAAVGAAIGSTVGHPVIGAIVGVLPDAVLGVTRKPAPTTAYKLTHSALCCTFACAVLAAFTPLWYLIFTAWMSHIVLDMFTHCKEWAPKPLYPFSTVSYGNFAEWEFFNKSWNYGLALTMGIILLCVLL